MRRTIYLVRHGQSEGNVDLKAYAHGDHAVPLTGLGRQQARAAGEAILASIRENHPRLVRPMGALERHAMIWTSPYKRCRETAAEIAAVLGCQVRESILLREQEYGLCEGLTDEEVEARFPAFVDRQRRLKASQGKMYVRYPDGESRADVAQRVHQFFGSVHRDDYDPVIVSTHGVTIRAFRMMWHHKTVEWFDEEPNPANCEVRLIDGCDDGGVVWFPDAATSATSSTASK